MSIRVGDRPRAPGRLVRAFALVILAVASTSHARAPSAPRAPADPVQEPRTIRSRRTGLATFVTAPRGGSIAVAPVRTGQRVDPIQFLKRHGSVFGVVDADRELVPARRTLDTLGQTHTTFQQVYNAVPVFSGVLKVHQDDSGEIVAANGHFRPLPARIDTTAKIGVDQAGAIARERGGAASPVVERSELVIVDPGWYGDPPAGVHVAYHLILTDADDGKREAYFIDAHTGAVLDRWSLTHTALNRAIHDGGGEAGLPGPLARSEGEEPVVDAEEVNRAYDYLGDTYDYFLRAFGRDSVDGMGLDLVATVNSTVAGCPNAHWSGNRLQAAFCTGVTADDVVAHEIMHGVTQFTADLIYQNQSGQLNESYSDIFGELVDLFNGDAAFVDTPVDVDWPEHPTGGGTDEPNFERGACSAAENGYPDGVRWLIGEDIATRTGALRDMWSPPCLGDPDRANSDLQRCSSTDAGGVHSGSGVMNHAFALVTDGGSFNGFDISGIGPIKSGAVWYRALTTYLTVASDFEDAYAALNQSAVDLIGTNPNDPRTGLPSQDAFTAIDAQLVDLALQAVEMNTPGRCGASVDVLRSDGPVICANRTTIFREDFDDDLEWLRLGWRVSHSGPSGPPTPYDWVRTSAPLPLGRAGRALFCDDPSIGDCDVQDESALHSIITPSIEIPDDAAHVMLSLTHYVSTEPGWDGGAIHIQVDDGEWQAVPSRAFLYNPYNSIIRRPFYGNTNPIAGSEGWTGIGGGWGTSVVDLGPFLLPGDAVRIRFDFGKDGCGGSGGWYVDDIEVFSCPDCNRNDRPDVQDLSYTRASDPLGNIGVDVRQRFLVGDVPPAAGDVTLTFLAVADLEFEDERLRVLINGVYVGTVFDVGAQDCPTTPNADRIVIPAATFNQASEGAEAVVEIVASETVNPVLCGGASFVKVFMEYDALAPDDNDNGVPDECEGCGASAPPSPLVDAWPANRYLAMRPGNPGRRTAMRVEVVHDTGVSFGEGGRAMWVSAPHAVYGTDHGAASAGLTCDPVYSDWSAFDEVLVYGEAIVPNGAYRVTAVDLACHDNDERIGLAEGVTFATARWGDVVGATGVDPPDGVVDFQDIVAAVDAFARGASDFAAVRADVSPATPDGVVDFTDIAAIVDAFVGSDYPFAPTDPCP